MLLLGMVTKKQTEKTIEQIKNLNRIVEDYDEGKESLTVTQLGMSDEMENEKYGTMYSNRLAVIYLFTGYLIGIWGENGREVRAQEALMSVALFAVICTGSMLFTGRWAKRNI